MINSPLSWFGGKHYHLKHILPFPQHKIFVDVFGGGGCVILNKQKDYDNQKNIYNDTNQRLVNFFRVFQNRYEELCQLCDYRGSFQSRELFEKYKEESDDDLEDAFRFFYVNRFSHSGNNATLAGYDFVKNKNKKRIYDNKVLKLFPIIRDELKYILIECQDFRRIIKRFDSKNTVFYVDPPYLQGGENYEVMIGGEVWGDSNIHDLITLLNNMRGKWVFSYDVIPDGLENIKDVVEIKRKNCVSISSNRTYGKEYVIRNFEVENPKTL